MTPEAALKSREMMRTAKDKILETVSNRIQEQTTDISLEGLLRVMPAEWRNERVSSYTPIYSDEMVATVFQAAAELEAEGKLCFVHRFTSIGHISTVHGQDTRLGCWEIGVRLGR